MFNTGEVRRNGYMNSALGTVKERMQAASDAQAKSLAGGEPVYAGNVDLDHVTDEAVAKITNDLYREGLIYYGQTHRHPNSTFRYTEASLMALMTWDARDRVELITAPLLMMAGDKADSLYMTKEVFELATGTKDKELFLIPGATHIQTYWRPEYVNAAVGKLADFYGRHMK